MNNALSTDMPIFKQVEQYFHREFRIFQNIGDIFNLKMATNTALKHEQKSIWGSASCITSTDMLSLNLPADVWSENVDIYLQAGKKRHFPELPMYQVCTFLLKSR